MSQGVLQTFKGYGDVTGLTGVTQTFGYGPVAGQEAIKMLGTNGGGFFNVNSAMPYENPTWFSNFVEMLAILIIPAGLTAMYGRMVGNRRQGWMVFGAMMTLFVAAVAVIYVNESGPTPAMHAAGLTGDNLEGKEHALRHRLELALRRHHHRRVVRRRQRRDGVAQRLRRRRSRWRR